MKKTIMFVASLVIILISLQALSQEASKTDRWILKPFWKTSIMEGESMFFIQEKSGELPQSSFLFTPDKILSIKSATEEITYTEGKDYVFNPGTKILSLAKDTKIPFKTKEEMYPPAGAPQSIKAFRGGNTNLFFSEGRVFHDLQVVVTYTHTDAWKGYTPNYAGKNLPAAVDKLKNRTPFTLLLYGDSISRGYNASGVTKAPPFMPSYGDLITLNLEAAYKTKINFVNLSVGGKTSQWGIDSISQVVKEQPDLVVIAFGMNDASRTTPAEQFAANVQKMIDEVRKSKPAAEFILIATMTGNPEWTKASPELYPQYRDALDKLCTKGVVLADMTAMWTDLLKQKKFADITGNGVNHPNDFAHRIYAEVILGLLVK